MIYRFIMLSDEVDDFRREYRIDGDATFLELHELINQSVNYDNTEMASFFICDDDWSKEAEITLFEMNTKSEEDSLTMSETSLSDYLEDERQKLLYQFDYLNDRCFFMELREIIFGENMDEGIISKSVGQPPLQILPIEEEPIKPTPTVNNLAHKVDDFGADDFNPDNFSSDSYNEDELDADGFGDEDMGEENSEEEGEEDFNPEELDL